MGELEEQGSGWGSSNLRNQVADRGSFRSPLSRFPTRFASLSCSAPADVLYENWLCPRPYRRVEDGPRVEGGPADQCPGGAS
jgi:hypothetical protein